MQYTDIGIDLGTASILVYIRGKGVVLKEPSVVAFDRDTNRIKAIGEDARLMLGRTPGNIVAIRPLREGVISDYDMTERMLKEFIRKVACFMVFKPRVIICVPSGITEVEERAVVDAGIQSGCRRVYLIEEPIAAAIGAGIDIMKPDGHMVVDIGGGTADIAVISLGGVVESASIKVAGDQFNEAVVKYMRRKHNILVGESTAEKMKIAIGCVYPKEEETTMDVKGRCLLTGLPTMATPTISPSTAAATLNLCPVTGLWCRWFRFTNSFASFNDIGTRYMVSPLVFHTAQALPPTPTGWRPSRTLQAAF